MTLRIAAALVAALLVAAPASAENRRKVAVLEFRAGVEQARDLAARLGDRLKKTAALTVVGPVEARQKSARIDAEVARCAGETPCLSKIGARLEVDEILLVGISKIGDAIMALQRIDVAEATVTAQLSELLPPSDELDDKKLNGWLKQLYPPDVFKRYGYIVITANLDGATVSLNGQEKGETPLEGKLKVLAPRTYRVELVKSGFTPFAARIDVPPDATVEVRAELSAENGPVPWYKRWYLWAIVGGLAIGAAVGVTAYTLQPDMSQVMGYIQR